MRQAPGSRPQIVHQIIICLSFYSGMACGHMSAGQGAAALAENYQGSSSEELAFSDWEQSRGRRALLLRRVALSACSLADSSSRPKQARISQGAMALSAGLSKAACLEQFCLGCCQASQSAAAGVGRLAGPRPGPVHAREGKRPLAKRSRWLSKPLPATEPRQRFFSCWALFHAYAPHFAQKRMRPCPCTCATMSW